MPEPRYDAALAAAWHILARAGLPATPGRLSQITYAILDAMYEADRRLAGQATPPSGGPCPGN